MEKLNVVKGEVTKKGRIIFTLVAGERKEIIKVYAGLSWPNNEVPGYYCILAEEVPPGSRTKYEGQKAPRGKIHLLTEKESPDYFLKDMFLPLADDCTFFCCDKVFAYFSEQAGEHTDDAAMFRDFMYEHGHHHIRLSEAPHGESFKRGLSDIRTLIDERLLMLPEDSLARRQLKETTAEAMGDSPEVKLYAVNGLRFVVSAFITFSNPSSDWTPKRPYKPRLGYGLRR
jgi:hypothetical protein